ncbi:MAG TPA: arginine deiminase-related protein, partial [Bacteroidia bacterium]|nr:arginine deiminase-related protein [Bacteroidia bacterium]
GSKVIFAKGLFNNIYIRFMSLQTTGTIFMVRNNAFNFNQQTAGSNSFQHAGKADTKEVLAEFDAAVLKINDAGIDVTVFENNNIETPDAIFPNNWIAVTNKHVILFPMMAANRRNERNEMIINHYLKNGRQLLNFTHYESKNLFLEGTGSIVFDHEEKLAFCAISERSNIKVLNDVCQQLSYKAISFETTFHNQPVYHTNVLMSIGNGLAIVCKEIVLPNYHRLIEDALENTTKVIINSGQMQNFAGNVIALIAKNEPCWVMSENAFKSLNKSQLKTFEKSGLLIVVDVGTIEFYGGGGIRCMIAEVFL